ncbi:beta-glucoside-specific PTS transporter subunit IIABC [Paenibacillus sp. BAC0078]
MNYQKTAHAILDSVGGPGNVNSVIHCMTRLRFKLKDDKIPDKEQIKQIDGVITVVESGGQYQVVIGNDVPKVYAELAAKLGIRAEADAEPAEEKKGSIFSRFVDIVTGVFTPVVGGLAAAGILKGLLSLFITLHWLTEDMGTYKILFATADALFYFLPVLLGFSAGKKFGGNPYLSAILGAALVYPTMVSAYSEGVKLTFLNIPVVLMNYTSSVIPIIIGAFFAATIEKWFNKFIPSSIKMFVVPLLTLVIASPVVFLVVGPVATFISNMLADGAMGVYSLSPVVAGLILAGVWQVLIIFGLHWAFVPILINNVVTNGFDPINAMLFCTTFAQTGAAFAIALKTRDKRLKPIATSATIAGIMGVTEPAIYGVTLPTKKPFILASIMAGIAGSVAGMFGAKAYGFAVGGVFGIPLFIGPEGVDRGFIGYLISLVVAFVGAFIVTLLFGYKNAPVAAAGQDQERPHVKVSQMSDEKEKAVLSPMSGEWKPLTEVQDEAFSTGAMGKGAAIVPSVGVAYAPFNGTVVTMFKTKHAIGLISDEGVEMLIHIGIDTVKLKGEHFTSFVKEGDSIAKGDKLIEFDKDAIRRAGYDITTSVIVSNTAMYSEITVNKYDNVDLNDVLFLVKE